MHSQSSSRRPNTLTRTLLISTSVTTLALALSFMATSVAQAQEITGTTGAATGLTGGAAITSGTTGGQFGAINTTGGTNNPASITLTQSETIRIQDSFGLSNSATVAGDFVIANGVVGTVIFAEDAFGADGDDAGLIVTGDLEGAADTRGGTLNKSVRDGIAQNDSDLTVNGSTFLEGITLRAGAGIDADAAGGDLAATFGDGDDTFDVTGLTVSGGNGGGANAGGDTNVTINADGGAGLVTIGATGLSVTGGNADVDGSGGTATLTIADSATIAGSTTVTSGNEGTGNGNGGNATLNFNDAAGTVTLTGALTIATGTDGVTGTSAAGNATARFASTTINANGGIVLTEQDAATANLVLDGTGAQTLTGAITVTNDGDGALAVTNSGGDATVVNFASTIGASGARIGTITLTNAGIVDFDGAVFAGTITTATGTVEAQFDADVDATGIDASAGDTFLDFNANVTIGANDLRLGGGSGGGTFAGNIAGTGTVRLDTGVAVDFDGTETQTIATAVTTDTAENGNINISNTSSGGVVFSSTIGTAGSRVGGIALNPGANATFNGEVQAIGLTMTAGSGLTVNNPAAAGTPMIVIEANSGLTIADGTINLGGEVGDGDIVFDLTTDAGEDLVDGSGGDGGTVINLAPTFTAGTITLIDDNAALVAGEIAQFTVTDTALVDYTLENTADGGNDLTITAAARTTDETATQLGVSDQEVGALTTAVGAADAGGDTEALTAFSNALNSGGADATTAAQQAGVQGDTQGGASTVAFNAVSQQQTVTSNRLASSRGGSSGFAGGGGGHGYNNGGAYWLQGFGGFAMADGDANAAGYDAGFGGVALGADGELSNGVTVGLFGSYTHSSVEGDGAGRSHLTSDTYLLGAYGGFANDHIYLDGFAAWAYATNDTSRVVVVGGIDRTYVGEFGSNQATLALSGGAPLALGHQVIVTPNAGLTWNLYAAQSYTETGTGALTAEVDSDSVNQLTGTVGARIHAVFEGIDHTGTALIPELRVGMIYDLVDDDAVSTATFTGGGSSFQTTGTDTDDMGALVGVGLGLDNPDWSATLTYDADLRSDYQSHLARAEVRVKF